MNFSSKSSIKRQAFCYAHTHFHYCIKTMYFVVDVECLKSIDNHLLVKELGIAAGDNNTAKTWLFCPPHKFNLLPPPIRGQNRWITAHLHGMRWDHGLTKYHKLQEILNDHIPADSMVFIKGSEKTELLRPMLPGRQLVDLHDIGCPPIIKIKLEMPPIPKCCWTHHLFGNQFTNHCALYKCQVYRNWYRSKLYFNNFYTCD